MSTFPWSKFKKEEDKLPSVSECQSHISGTTMARIQLGSLKLMRQKYGDDFVFNNIRILGAVGPLQTYIGYAIMSGYLKVGDKE